MEYNEFAELVGKDIIVDYPFGGELQKWNMKNFYFDEEGHIKHNRLPLIIKKFIANARNPHTDDEATHG